MAGVRFAPGQFRYNGRVAASLLPSLVVLAGFGGTVPVGVALVGAMVSYILDAMRFREGALLAVWMTLGTVNLSFWLSGAIFYVKDHLALSLLIAICISITLFTTGVWATLQFKWVQIQYPVVVLAFEKMLLAVAFTVAAMVQSWGLTAAVGASQAPFYLVPVLCTLYFLLAQPLTTSFHVRGAKESAIGGKRSMELQVQSDVEGVSAALVLVLLPAGLYAVLHASMLREWVHLWSLLLLASLPILFLSVLEEGLWWLPGGPKRLMAVRRLLCLGALGAALAGLEGRLIFPAFGQYIQIHPPWNYAAITIALYGAAALAVAYLGGLLSESAGSSLAGGALLLSAGLGAVAAGMPLFYMVAPVISAGGLALFLESRKIQDYSLFVGGAALTAAWFIYHHFWFLEVSLQGLPLQYFCVVLWVAVLVALILPGLVSARLGTKVLATLLITEALLVGALEEHLYLGADEIQGEMYPAGMVIATSALGLAVTHRLRGQRQLCRLAFWFLQCVFSAKLSMLILPQERLIIPVLLLTLAVTSPYLILMGTASRPRKERLQPWQGLLVTLAVVLTTLNARYAVFDALHLIFGARPSEGTLLGVLVLVGAGGCAPLVWMHYSQRRDTKRLLVLVAMGGALLVLLRPPLPLQGGAKCPEGLPSTLCFRLWDQAHAPEHELDDVAIWGEFGERRDRWPLWMLIGAAITALTAATAQFPASDSATRGLGYAALSGLSVGAYIALEFFPGQLALQVVVLIATLALAGVLVGLKMRGAASPTLIGLLLVIWASSLPSALFIQAVVPLPVLPEDARRLFADMDILVENQRQDSNRAALLAVYSAEALLLAFAIKLRISAALTTGGVSMPESGSQAAAVLRFGNAYAEQAASFLGQCLPSGSAAPKRASSHRGSLGGALAQLSHEGLGWLPTAGNLITVGCLGTCLVLNGQLTQGSSLAIFVLAPILVLLNQDSFLSALDSRRRYSPVAAAISSFLAATSVQQAFTIFALPASLTSSNASSTVALLKNLWLAAAALPCHFYFNQYLWKKKPIKGRTLLLAAPINVAGLIFSDQPEIQLLAGSAIVMAGIQYVAMQQVRREGMRLI